MPKKTRKTEMPATTEPATKPVRLDLPPDAHRLLRLVSASAEKSMASYAREALEAHLRAEAKRLGLKG